MGCRKGSIDGMSPASVQAPPADPERPRLVIAGATGTLGQELLQRALAMPRLGACEVLVREPLTVGVRGVSATVVPPGDPSTWPPASADIGLILFEPPRDLHGRERALWVPAPQQLPALARWMHGSGVRTLGVVLPHARGLLPAALRHGLANLDEHAVAALGFHSLLFVRAPHAPAEAAGGDPLQRLARRMLSIFKYMVPSNEQPVRSARLAELVLAALELAPAGTHVAAPQHLWQAQAADAHSAVRQWLRA